MPLELNYLPGIEKKTGKTTKDFVAAAVKAGMTDPAVKTGVRMAWLKKEFGLGQGHALFMSHTIMNALAARTEKR